MYTSGYIYYVHLILTMYFLIYQYKRDARISASTEEACRVIPRDYVESLHQNSKSTLLYGKNNVLVQPVSSHNFNKYVFVYFVSCHIYNTGIICDLYNLMCLLNLDLAKQISPKLTHLCHMETLCKFSFLYLKNHFLKITLALFRIYCMDIYPKTEKKFAL